MKKIISMLVLCLAMFCGGCRLNVNISESGVEVGAQTSTQSAAQHSGQPSAQNSSRQSQTEKPQSQADSAEAETQAASGFYTMADIDQLLHTEHFAKKTLEHIFDGTINSQGKATGYHYARVSDSKGEIIAGTESAPDRHGVYTAKVKVGNTRKNGFSSFYPDSWTPQQVIDAINEAYEDAINDTANPHGSLWIGYSGDLEINMYLDSSKRITTAYPIYEGD